MRSVRLGLGVLAAIMLPLFAATAASAIDLRRGAQVEIKLADSGAPEGAGAGRPVSLAVSVSPASGKGTPTGTVTLRHDGDAIAQGVLKDGRVDFRAGLLAGTHTYSADYDGDGDFTPSSSDERGSATYTAGPETLDATVAASSAQGHPGTSAQGQPVTLTLALAFQPAPPPTDDTDGWTDLPTSLAIAPTGTVTFSDNGKPLATVPVDAPVTAFTTDELAVGLHAIGTRYSGDANFVAVTSDPVYHSVEPAAVAPISTVAPPSTTPTTAPSPSTPPATTPAADPPILAGLLSNVQPQPAPVTLRPGPAVAVTPDEIATRPAAQRVVAPAVHDDGNATSPLLIIAAFFVPALLGGAGWTWRKGRQARSSATDPAPA